jgi:hypothetical protein
MNVFLITVGLVLVLYLIWRDSRQPPGASLPPAAQEQLRRELRKSPRVELLVPVDIKGHQRTTTGASRNISTGGMLVKAEIRLSSGEPVEVAFVLPDGPRIEMQGVVCRLQGEQAGIRFDPAHRQIPLIERWIEQRRPAEV